MDIVFFGSGPVAAQSLKRLQKHFSIETVITKPRPPHHKGAVPVLDVAANHSLNVLTAANKAELSNLMADVRLRSKIAILIDFGIIVTKDVIDYFPLGIVNSHFSLLPKWRGADPISFALLEGDKKTGVSLMLIDEGMDTGKILAQKSLPITSEHTGITLTDDLIALSDSMLKEVLPKYVAGGVAPTDQSGPPSYSRKLTKQDGVIDWRKPATKIEREIRAFTDWPRSRTKIGSKDVIIQQANVVKHDIQAGQFKVLKNKLLVGCGKDSLEIKKLQPAGKKPMNSQQFLTGYKDLLS